MLRLPTSIAIVAAAVGVAAGCSPANPGTAAHAPVLRVSTGLFPLAEAARLIGGSKVAVEDPVAAGSDPFTFKPDAAETAAISSAGLVVEIGGGFQPGFEAAAGGSSRVLALARSLDASDPYVWLDPATMGKVVSSMTEAMISADPGAAPLFRQNESGVQAEISSLAADFSSTLGACPGRTLITPDGAFSALAGSNELTDRVVGAKATSSDIAAVAGLVEAGPPVAIIIEPWVADQGVEQVTAASGARAVRIDTLAVAPAGMTSSASGYQALMEDDLGRLSGALGCSNSEP